MFSDKASIYASRLGAGPRIRKRSVKLSASFRSLARDSVSPVATQTESISVDMNPSVSSSSTRPHSVDVQSTGDVTILPRSGTLVMEKTDSELIHDSTPVSNISTAHSNVGSLPVHSVAWSVSVQGMSLKDPSAHSGPGQGGAIGLDVTSSMQHRSGGFLAGDATTLWLSLARKEITLRKFILIAFLGFPLF